jgi:hypothetical protein
MIHMFVWRALRREVEVFGKGMGGCGCRECT